MIYRQIPARFWFLLTNRTASALLKEHSLVLILIEAILFQHLAALTIYEPKDHAPLRN